MAQQVMADAGGTETPQKSGGVHPLYICTGFQKGPHCLTISIASCDVQKARSKGILRINFRLELQKNFTVPCYPLLAMECSGVR